MENAAKALEMAAGVLLGIIILTLIGYFLSTISIFPQEEDNRETAEQLSKFNLEYEVYDKKAMYGADVISCLAKAQSNNEKYVEGGSLLTGSKYGDEYWIDVYVNLKSNLSEELIVYCFDIRESSPTASQKIIAFDVAKKASGNSYTMEDAGFIFRRDSNNRIYSNFSEVTELKNSEEELIGNGYIDYNEIVAEHNGIQYNGQLYNQANPNEETPLQRLISFTSSNMKQIVNNNTGIDLSEWCSAEWRTALYDFKTRRFKCDNITYNKETGRVRCMYFSEI